MWWITSYLCPVRAVGDIALAISIPILLARIVRNGPAGVSLRTQILHTLIFAMRYLDLFYPVFEDESFMNTIFTKPSYNDVVKTFFTLGSASVMLVLAWKKYTSRTLITSSSKPVSEVILMISASIWLGLTFNYLSSTREVLWASSQYLSIVAEIPQLVATYKAQNRDVGMYIYLGTVAAFRTLYLPHYLMRYVDQGVVDPIGIFSAAAQLCVLYIGFVLLATQERQQEDIIPRFDRPDVKFVLLVTEYTDDGIMTNEFIGEKQGDCEIV